MTFGDHGVPIAATDHQPPVAARGVKPPRQRRQNPGENRTRRPRSWCNAGRPRCPIAGPAIATWKYGATGARQPRDRPEFAGSHRNYQSDDEDGLPARAAPRANPPQGLSRSDNSIGGAGAPENDCSGYSRLATPGHRDATIATISIDCRNIIASRTWSQYESYVC